MQRQDLKLMEKFYSRMMTHIRSKASHGQRSLIEFTTDLKMSILAELLTNQTQETPNDANDSAEEGES